MIQFDHMIFPCHGNCPQRKFCLPLHCREVLSLPSNAVYGKGFLSFFPLNSWFIGAYANGLTAELNITAVWTVGRGSNPDGRKMLQMVMIKMKIWFLKPRNRNVKQYRGYPIEGDCARRVYRGKLTLNYSTIKKLKYCPYTFIIYVLRFTMTQFDTIIW